MFSSTPITCQFELTRSTRIFYSGDQVCGKIILKTTKKLNLEGIFLNITGIEHIQWYEYNKNLQISYDDSSTHNAADNKISFKANKEYILTSVQLSEEIELEPGEFVADFNLNLPDQLLATCKQSYGCMDYHLNVILQRKNAAQKVFQQCLFLRNRVDLNKETNFKKPIKIQCTLPENGVCISLPQRTFVPGQVIPLGIELSHISNNIKIVINLCQKISYTSQIPTMKLKEVIKVQHNYIASNTKSGLLRVPFTTPITTTLDYALMRVSYYLECFVLNGKFEILYKNQIPIIIGTIALKNSEELPVHEVQRLYTYDNLAAIKEEFEDNFQKKLINFDFIACELHKNLGSHKKIMTSKGNVHELWKKLYRNLLTKT